MDLFNLECCLYVVKGEPIYYLLRSGNYNDLAFRMQVESFENACYKSWRNSTIVGCRSATKIGPGEAKRRFSKKNCYCYFVYL